MGGLEKIRHGPGEEFSASSPRPPRVRLDEPCSPTGRTDAVWVWCGALFAAEARHKGLPCARLERFGRNGRGFFVTLE